MKAFKQILVSVDDSRPARVTTRTMEDADHPMWQRSTADPEQHRGKARLCSADDPPLYPFESNVKTASACEEPDLISIRNGRYGYGGVAHSRFPPSDSCPALSYTHPAQPVTQISHSSSSNRINDSARQASPPTAKEVRRDGHEHITSSAATKNRWPRQWKHVAFASITDESTENTSCSSLEKMHGDAGDRSSIVAEETTHLLSSGKMENPVFTEESVSSTATPPTTSAMVTLHNDGARATADRTTPDSGVQGLLHVDTEKDTIRAGSASSLLELPDGLTHEERQLEILRDVIRKCTNPDPCERPTAAEVLNMLNFV
ncbi:PREDICTED: uncharacterized protein LOC106807163 [Priapulus caudatus]|uniref:Uncharacterized protein LOC106807163 n=1 Tax=Priapulus caudatus TaxID=37621 RepID=A0ABM1DY95_PRICU|nr:PREDICTED: uncharacterized protein LOC106807163 [Priapulus caudatus]